MCTIQKYRSWLWKYFLLLLLQALLVIKDFVNIEAWGKNGWNCIAICAGGIPTFFSDDFIAIFLYCIPMVVSFYLYGDFFRQDFIISYVYVFTRYGEKKKWILGKLISVLLLITLQTALVCLCIIIVGVILGYSFMPITQSMIFMLLQIFLLNTLSLFLFVLFENLLSFRQGEAKACFLTICLYIILLIAGLQLGRLDKIGIWMLRLNPVCQSMYLWHGDAILPTECQNAFLGSESYTVMWSVLFLFFMIAVIIVLFYQMIQKKDLMDIVGGAL